MEAAWGLNAFQGEYIEHGDLKNYVTADDLLGMIVKSPGELDELLKFRTDAMGGDSAVLKLRLAKHFMTPTVSVRKACILASAPDDQIERCYFFLYNLKEEELDDEETVDSLEEKFLRTKLKDTGLQEAFPGMKHLVVSGRDFAVTTADYQHMLTAHFDLAHLSGVDRVQRGETDRIRKKKLDEDVPKGYGGIEDFVDDQKSVFSLPFHQ